MSTKFLATYWLASLQLITFAALLGSPSAFAATYYWNTLGTQNTNVWSNGPDWANAASGGTTGTAPGSGDFAVFNVSATNGTTTTRLSADATIAGITFNNTGSTTIQSSGTANRILTNGSGGITIASGAGAVNLSITSINRPLSVALGASQGWTNNSANPLTFNYSSTAATSLDLGANTLTVAGSGATTLNTIVKGSGGALSKINAGTLTLTNANTYSGATTVSAGTLRTSTASTGAGSYAVSDNATLGISIASAGQTLNMSSLTLGSSAGPSTLNITLGANDPTATVIADAGALTLNGTATVNVTGGASLSGATIVLLSYASAAGAGSISAGTLPSISGFITTLTNDASAQQVKLVFTAGSPPVQWSVGSGNWDTTTANWQPLGGGSAVNYVENAPVTFDDNGIGTGPITVTLTAGRTPGSVTVNNSAKDYVLAGSVITSAGGLTKSGSSQLTLSAANSFVGALTMSGGTLNLGAATQTVGVVTISGGTITNGTLNGSSYAGQSGTLSAALAGSGALTKTTVGALMLYGANSYGGDTTVSDGTLSLGAAGVIPNGIGKGNVSVTGIFDLNGFSEIINGLSGAGVVSNGVAGTQTLTVGDNNQASTFSGVIKTGTGDLALAKVGTGILTLSGANTYGGGTTINLGTVRASSATAMGTGIVTIAGGQLNLGADTSIAGLVSSNNTGMLLLGGNSTALRTLTIGAGGIIVSDTVTNSFRIGNVNNRPVSVVLAGSQAWINNSTNLTQVALNGVTPNSLDLGANTLTFGGSGSAIIDAPIIGTGGIVKNGTGSLYLDGANTYSTTTTVNTGTLAGTGSFASPVTVGASATLSPGTNAIGTLTINNTLTNAGTILMEVDKASGTNDVVTGLTTLNYGGTLIVTNLSSTLVGGESFRLFSATTYNGNFTATNLPPLVPGLNWVWTPSTGTLSVSGTPTPTSITPSVSGGVLTLTWPGAYVGWSAQSNSVDLASASDWHTIPGSQSVTNLIITMDPARTNVFYRLTLP
ncbi:MAG: autotransporter-associated beta strand repeat-containing protein [Verrucomicrobiae bacterium]